MISPCSFGTSNIPSASLALQGLSAQYTNYHPRAPRTISPYHRLGGNELTVPVLMSLMQLRHVSASFSALPELPAPPDRTREADLVCGIISAATCNDRTITDDRLGDVLIAGRQGHWHSTVEKRDAVHKGLGLTCRVIDLSPPPCA